MTTITINERTKAGKTFLEFVRNLPFVVINEDVELNAPEVVEKKVSKQKQIMQLSKEVNRNMTKKLLEKHNIKL
jgi:hypothetical protein